MKETTITVSNKLGLHARAAAKLTQLASKFSSDIFIQREDKQVNAKSIMGVMMLAAGKGVELKLQASGDDEEQASQEIEALFNNKFDEGE